MILQDEDYVSLPVPWLYEILASDPPSHVFTASLRSKLTPTDFTPKKIRIECGRLLAAHPKTAELFMVFLYEDTKHAEIWPRREWDASLSKRILLLSKTKVEMAEYNRSSESSTVISSWIETNMSIPKDTFQSKKLTQIFYKLTLFPKELESLSGLKELLTQYGNLNKNFKPSQGPSPANDRPGESVLAAES